MLHNNDQFETSKIHARNFILITAMQIGKDVQGLYTTFSPIWEREEAERTKRWESFMDQTFCQQCDARVSPPKRKTTQLQGLAAWMSEYRSVPCLLSEERCTQVCSSHLFASSFVLVSGLLVSLFIAPLLTALIYFSMHTRLVFLGDKEEALLTSTLREPPREVLFMLRTNDFFVKIK